MKSCTRCGETKPLDAFSPNRHRSDGRQSWCRDCSRQKRAERRAEGQTTYDRLYGRAKWRALTELMRRHDAEFRRLLDAEIEAEWARYRESRKGVA